MEKFKKAFLTALVALGIPAVFTVSTRANMQANLSPAPEDAIVLFDGTDFSNWTDQSGNPVDWKIIDGVMEVVPKTKADYPGSMPKPAGIITKQNFQDFRLHVEFNVPNTKNTNSGVYIQRRYEVQIVDSYGKPFRTGMCGALYKQKAPDRNVCKKPGQWQTYDIIFRAARFEQKGEQLKKVENARITVLHNGIVIHNNVLILDKTGNGRPEGPEPGPILLQDHGSRVRYRNIWIVPLDKPLSLSRIASNLPLVLADISLS